MLVSFGWHGLNDFVSVLIRLIERLHNVLEATGGGFRRDMEQVTNDNQGCCDARLCGESNVERPFLVS